MHGRYVTDILKMCMKKFNAEKYFLTNLQGFDLHIAGGYTVSLACSQFLVYTCNETFCHKLLKHMLEYQLMQS